MPCLRVQESHGYLDGGARLAHSTMRRAGGSGPVLGDANAIASGGLLDEISHGISDGRRTHILD